MKTDKQRQSSRVGETKSGTVRNQQITLETEKKGQRDRHKYIATESNKDRWL